MKGRSRSPGSVSNARAASSMTLIANDMLPLYVHTTNSSAMAKAIEIAPQACETKKSD